jgi:hypothetical protein
MEGGRTDPLGSSHTRTSLSHPPLTTSACAWPQPSDANAGSDGLPESSAPGLARTSVGGSSRTRRRRGGSGNARAGRGERRGAAVYELGEPGGCSWSSSTSGSVVGSSSTSISSALSGALSPSPSSSGPPSHAPPGSTRHTAHTPAACPASARPRAPVRTSNVWIVAFASPTTAVRADIASDVTTPDSSGASCGARCARRRRPPECERWFASAVRQRRRGTGRGRRAQDVWHHWKARR